MSRDGSDGHGARMSGDYRVPTRNEREEQVRQLTKMGMELRQLKKDASFLTNKLDTLEARVSAHAVLLDRFVEKDTNQEDLLKSLKKDVSEQGEFVSAMKKSHATSIKILTMVGGSLLSVLGSLLIWLLTKR